MKKLLSLLSAFALISAGSCSSGNKGDSQPAPMVSVGEERFNEDGLPILTVGVFGQGAIDPLLTDYYFRPADYEVQVKDYTEGIDYSAPLDEQREAMRRSFDMSLVAGEIPDIIFGDPADITRLDRQGMLADLYPIMDSGDGIKREDFTDCALRGLTVDGRLPAIVERYSISTVVAKTELIGKEYTDWTAEQAMEMYQKYITPDSEMTFCGRGNELAMADLMLRKEGIGGIDITAGTVDLSGEFTRLLDFCKENPVPPERAVDYGSLTDEEWRYLEMEQDDIRMNNKQLVFGLYIQEIGNQLGYATFAAFGGADLTFVGYPSENGYGAVAVQADRPMMAICEASPNKDKAWELINLMIKHRGAMPLEPGHEMGLATLKYMFEEDLEKAADKANSINIPTYTFSDGKEYPMPREYKDMLRDYILTVPVDLYSPRELTDIIEEEYQPVILDTRTAEQAAEIIKNRVEIYLSEKN